MSPHCVLAAALRFYQIWMYCSNIFTSSSVTFLRKAWNSSRVILSSSFWSTNLNQTEFSMSSIPSHAAIPVLSSYFESTPSLFASS